MLHSLWHISNFRDESLTSHVASDMAARAQTRASEAQQSTQDLEERLDKLTLITMALWELLRERANLTEADLLAKVQDLDLRDGTPDGKLTRTVRQCPACNRNMSPRHGKCLYCGHEKLIESAFDSL